MKTVLPDSNIVIDLFNGIRSAASQLTGADRILLSPMVIGEVCAGSPILQKTVLERPC